MIYRDEGLYRAAVEQWQRERLSFETQESERLSRLQKRLDASPVMMWFSLPAIGFAVVAGYANGFAAGVVLFFLQALVLSWVGEGVQRLARWKHRGELVPRAFTTPEPTFERPAYQSPPRREQTSSAPPPRRAEPPKPEPPLGEIRISSLAQACRILGLAPGRITLSEVKAAYRHKIALCHPDLTMRLDKELQALAARKTLELNLAFQYIKTHLQ